MTIDKLEKKQFLRNFSTPIFKPLLVGCSGGGGHNSAILGIISYLKKQYGEDLRLLDYVPRSLLDEPSSVLQNKINTGIEIMHSPFVGGAIRGALYYSYVPILPSSDNLKQEICTLSNKELSAGKRQYIDMLLDVVPAGYECAAIWNVLQRNDKNWDLKKLVEMQASSDTANYTKVYKYFFNKLQAAAKKDQEPYTEIISTQVLGLAALSDAVISYNKWVIDNKLDNPPIIIHQYLTDLPTKGAVHFLKPLSHLNPEQQSVMRIYGLETKDNIFSELLSNRFSFSKVSTLSASANPMIRSGFKKRKFDNSKKFNQPIPLHLLNEPPILIQPQDKIASIMLGSQTGQEILSYLLPLFENGLNKVFLFGARNNPHLSSQLDNFRTSYPQYSSNLFPLTNQNDEHIAALMTRSNILIIRGGGLCVMEQLAMMHNPLQSVFVHFQSKIDSEYSSGIPWEDENVNCLFQEFQRQNVYCEKINPTSANRQIGEAILIAAVKKFNNLVLNKDALQHIKNLSNPHLKVCISALKISEKESIPVLPQVLINHFIQSENDDANHLAYIRPKLNKIISILSYSLIKEALKYSEINLEKHKLRSLKQAFYYIKMETLIKHKTKNEYKFIYSLINAIEDMRQLLQQLDGNKDLSSTEKLIKFNEQFSKQADLLSRFNDSILNKVIEDITLFLARFFIRIYQRLTPQQEIKFYLNIVKKEHKLDFNNTSFFKASFKELFNKIHHSQCEYYPGAVSLPD